MAVKIRLTRTGRKKLPSYRVVVADSRMPRDGRFIEAIGFYDPKTDPSTIDIDTVKAKAWLSQGAQPSNTVRKLLAIAGVNESPGKPSGTKPVQAKATGELSTPDKTARSKKETDKTEAV